MILPRTRLFRSLMIATIWLGLWSSSAYAHGGIAGPDELGPPVIISAILGFGGYWTVILWPSRKSKDDRNKGQRRPQRKPTRRSVTAI
jgi:hypothetical protein